jgi:hypothetical protein
MCDIKCHTFIGKKHVIALIACFYSKDMMQLRVKTNCVRINEIDKKAKNLQLHKCSLIIFHAHVASSAAPNL